MIRRVAGVFVVMAVGLLGVAAPAGADALSVTGFTPAGGPVGTSVVVTGTGFSSVSSVQFGGVRATFTVQSQHQLTAKVPLHAPAGSITVTRSRPAATATSTTDFNVTLPPDITPWYTFQANFLRTGKSTSSGPSGSGVRALWTYKAPSVIRDQPTVALDGSVYVGESGAPLCQLSAPGGTRNFCTTVGGQMAQSSATVGNPFTKTDAQGTRKVSTVYVGDRLNIFHAFDSEGAELWRYKINRDGDVRASAIIGPDPTNTVYMMCGCTTTGVVHAFTKAGALKWTLTIPQTRDASAAGVQFGPNFRMYAMDNNGELIAVDDLGSRGAIAWTLKLGTLSEHSTPAIGPDGTIYVSTSTGLFAVRDNGTSAAVKAGWPFTAINGAIDTTAAVSSGKVYISARARATRTLYALDASTGAQLWSKTGTGNEALSFSLSPSTVIGANGLVYQGFGNDVYAFDPALPNPGAAPRWHYVLGNASMSMSIGDGVLYVTAKDAKVYALVS